jgi:hypothetical protein
LFLSTYKIFLVLTHACVAVGRATGTEFFQKFFALTLPPQPPVLTPPTGGLGVRGGSVRAEVKMMESKERNFQFLSNAKLTKIEKN